MMAFVQISIRMMAFVQISIRMMAFVQISTRITYFYSDQYKNDVLLFRSVKE